MTVDPEELRQVMRHWPTGVTIVTSVFEGKRHGMTVNSFASLSLQPPNVSVTLGSTTRTHQLVERAGIFGVTLLKEDQGSISDRFAGKAGEEVDRFQGFEIETLLTGAPFLKNGSAFLDCRVIFRYPMKNSTLFIGEVVASWINEPGKPLLYFNRTYQRLSE